MIRAILIIISLSLSVIPVMHASPKKIKLTKFLNYDGEAEKKVPQGVGIITCNSKELAYVNYFHLKGTFANDSICNAELFLNGWTFKGNATYSIEDGGKYHSKINMKLYGEVLCKLFDCEVKDSVYGEELSFNVDEFCTRYSVPCSGSQAPKEIIPVLRANNDSLLIGNHSTCYFTYMFESAKHLYKLKSGKEYKAPDFQIKLPVSFYNKDSKTHYTLPKFNLPEQAVSLGYYIKFGTDVVSDFPFMCELRDGSVNNLDMIRLSTESFSLRSESYQFANGDYINIDYTKDEADFQLRLYNGVATGLLDMNNSDKYYVDGQILNNDGTQFIGTYYFCSSDTILKKSFSKEALLEYNAKNDLLKNAIYLTGNAILKDGSKQEWTNGLTKKQAILQGEISHQAREERKQQNLQNYQREYEHAYNVLSKDYGEQYAKALFKGEPLKGSPKEMFVRANELAPNIIAIFGGLHRVVRPNIFTRIDYDVYAFWMMNAKGERNCMGNLWILSKNNKLDYVSIEL